jgi:hypothetical protein
LNNHIFYIKAYLCFSPTLTPPLRQLEYTTPRQNGKFVGQGYFLPGWAPDYPTNAIAISGDNSHKLASSKGNCGFSKFMLFCSVETDCGQILADPKKGPWGVHNDDAYWTLAPAVYHSGEAIDCTPYNNCWQNNP